jgi:hypothetical protein
MNKVGRENVGPDGLILRFNIGFAPDYPYQSTQIGAAAGDALSLSSRAMN